MSELVKANLVNRRNGKYLLSSLGKIVYDAQTTIRKAIGNYWKLKAIDELELNDGGGMPKEEYNKIIDSLIDNERDNLYVIDDDWFLARICFSAINNKCNLRKIIDQCKSKKLKWVDCAILGLGYSILKARPSPGFVTKIAL